MCNLLVAGEADLVLRLDRLRSVGDHTHTEFQKSLSAAASRATLESRLLPKPDTTRGGAAWASPDPAHRAMRCGDLPPPFRGDARNGDCRRPSAGLV